MELNPFSRPHLNSLYPTVDTALWLLRLRWVAVVGQLTTICVVAFGLGYDIQLFPLLSLVSLTASTNALFWGWLNWFYDRPGIESQSSKITALVVAAQVLDVLCLSGLLFFSGGVFNPFALFYFVNLAMAGLILPPTWAWFVALLCILSQSLLLMHYLPLTAFGISFQDQVTLSSEARFAYWISFASSTCVVTYFITMPMAELRQREKLLAEVERQKTRSQKLEALATLAAGAGHELASPLSTIAVVSKEMSRNMEKMDVPQSLHNDIGLIRSELDRCREILNRMKSSAGEAAAEVLDPVSIEALFHEVQTGLRDASRVKFELDAAEKMQMAILPVQALSLAIRNLIQNAIDASSEDAEVHVRMTANRQEWIIQIADTGHGMDPEILRRIGEPFFTTKEPGRGMGMGVFLSQNVVARLGGSMEFESVPEEGTTCTLHLPVSGQINAIN